MNLIPFQFEENAVRVIEKDGEPWFVAKDVAVALGYSNPQAAVKRHCKSLILFKVHETRTMEIPPYGINIIPERDVYRLIMRSKLPSAERFEDWVVSEVLPSIRKTGRYVFNPEDVSKRDFAEWFLEADAKVKELEANAAIDGPKAEIHDLISEAENSVSLREAAKQLQMKPLTFNNWLGQLGWTFKQTPRSSWMAYQDKIDAGYLETSTFYIYRNNTQSHQVLVTPKGLMKLAKLKLDEDKQKSAMTYEAIFGSPSEIATH